MNAANNTGLSVRGTTNRPRRTLPTRANEGSSTPQLPRRRSGTITNKRGSVSVNSSFSSEGRTRKDLTEQEKLVSELSTKNQELDLVNRQFEGLQNKLNKLIIEKNGYVSEIGAVRNLRREDVTRMKQKLTESSDTMQETRIKLGRVEQIENGIFKLYLEMKQRSAEVVSNGNEDEDVVVLNVQELKKEDPLVLLDRLKVHLRTLLTFKDDYENELKDQLRRRKSEAELKLEQLKKRMVTLEKDTLLLKSNAEKAISIKDDALSKKQVISNESEKTIAALKSDHKEMMEMKANKEREINKLRSMLDRRDEILRHREIQMMKITQLQSQIEKNKTLHKLELNSMQSENNHVVKEKEKQLAFYNKVKAEKRELELYLRTLTTKLESYKLDANRCKYLELNERENKLEKKVLEMESNLDSARRELKTKETEVENLTRENQHLMKQYEDQSKKIRDSRIKTQQTADGKIKEAISKHYSENMEKNPQLADYYKKKVKEKEKEIADLTKQVRKMILSDHSDTVVQKNYEMEVFHLVSEIERLKRQAIARSSQADLEDKPEAQLRKRNQELEVVLQDYETIEREAKTQAVAYERLQSKPSTSLSYLTRSGSDSDSTGYGSYSDDSSDEYDRQVERSLKRYQLGKKGLSELNLSTPNKIAETIERPFTSIDVHHPEY
jgi:hypothetical protein